MKKLIGLGWLAITLLISSCQRDGFQPPVWYTSERSQVEAAAMDNSEMLSATHDIMDYTAGALAGQEVSGSGSPYGRATGSSLPCAPSIKHTFSIDRAHPDTLVFNGTLMLDFGTGDRCTDSRELRSGKITVRYVLTKFLLSHTFRLTETLSFEAFRKGAIFVDGTFIRTTTSEQTSTLDIRKVTLGYPDSTYAEFDGQLVTTLVWDGQGLNHRLISKKVIGVITGVNRLGTNFSAAIDSPLFYKYGCLVKIPVSGTIDLIVGAAESEISFGEGTCDRVYSISSGGVTSVYSYGEWRKADDKSD